MVQAVIIGPGAIGLCMGAALMQAGHAVTFAARQGFDTLKMTKTGSDPVTWPAEVVTAPDAVKDAPDWVFLCVKTHQVAGAADWLRAAVGERTRVAILQNGVEHAERVAPWVKAGTPLVPVVIDLPAVRPAAGEVVWHSRALMTVADTDNGRDLCALFAGSFLTARASADYVTENWKKLCMNAPSGAITALTGQPMGVLHRPGIAAIVQALLEECVAVGRAEGADLPDTLIPQQMEAFLAEDPQAGNSMYEDWKAGRETEWDARNGVIVRKGKAHGIATPVSTLLVPLLAAQRP